jgi:hypothetical protein
MNSNEINNRRQHLGLQKIDEFANGIRGIRDIIWDRKNSYSTAARNKTISTRSEYR